MEQKPNAGGAVEERRPPLWSEEALVKEAEEVARKLWEQQGKKEDNALDTQIRKILDGVRKLDAAFDRSGPKGFNPGRVTLLRPKLAYAVSRNKALRPLYEALEAVIPKVRIKEDFDQLIDFVEAVVAYHKFYPVRQEWDRQENPGNRPTKERR